jgi:riboflavin kinase/FMN adenylyltransferase
MKIIKSLEELKTNQRNSIGLTIGNFDGVHRGHRQLLGEMMTTCKKDNKKLLVMTFVPHPLVVLNAKKNFLLNSYDERRDLLDTIGVDYLLEEEFTRDFSIQTPESFVKRFIEPFSDVIGNVYIGYDFAFGSNKSGNIEDLQKIVDERNLDINVISFQSFKGDQGTFSSSLIRQELTNGNIEKVNDYLGRPFSVCALVKKGVERGRTIGFPTANLEVDPLRLFPKNGVYASQVSWQGAKYKSVTNVGLNPTFENKEDLKIETHILDFDEFIYGEKIKIEFLHRIRDEKKFNTVNDLIEQIQIDVAKRKEMN